MNGEDPLIQPRVLSVSSAAVNFPASAVVDGNPQSAGWRTVLGAGFPAFLVLELPGMYTLSSVQFVAHEQFVPASVELFTSEQSPAREWIRLGEARMGTAAAHNARERKTFKFKARVRLVKFMFSDYIQKPGATGQISLTSVQLRGVEEVDRGEGSWAGEMGQGQEGSEQQQGARMGIDDSVLQKKAEETARFFEAADRHKKTIEEAIQAAVDMDLFDDADRYLTALKKLELLRTQLEQLHLQKLSAIKHQDFKAASVIKKTTEYIHRILELDFPAFVDVLVPPPVQAKPEKQAPKEPKNPIPDTAQVIPTLQQSKVLQEESDGTEEQRRKKRREQQAAKATESMDKPINTAAGRAARAAGAKEEQQVDVNDPGIDPSKLRGKMFQSTEEDERKYQELINKKQKLQKLTEAEEAAQREETMKTRPVGFKIELSDQEVAHLVIQESKFPQERFTFEKFSVSVPAAWEKDDAKPPELSNKQQSYEDNDAMERAGIPMMILRLLNSPKVLDHVREGVRFMTSCVVEDPVRWVGAAIGCLKTVHVQQNQAMFNACQYLVCRCYLALIDKHTQQKYKERLSLKIKFLNRSADIAKQRDNAVVLASFAVRFQPGAQELPDAQLEEYLLGLMEKKVDFYNDVLTLLRPLFERLTSSLGPVKTVATNLLATLCSFPCFSPRNFFLQLLGKAAIDRVQKNTEDNALVKDGKYLLAVQARAVMARACIENAPWLVTQSSAEVIMQFCQWCSVQFQKAELKNACVFLLKQVYALGPEYPAQVVKMLNKNVPSGLLLKVFAQELIQLDQEQQVPAQVTFVEGNKKDKHDPPRIVCLSELAGQGKDKQALEVDFPPGVCQFCAREVCVGQKPEQMAKKMWEHLIAECPCCCVCPACKQVVEICYLPIHMTMARECPGRESYQYQLELCGACQMVFETAALEQHKQQCHGALKGDQLGCPLCGAVLEDGEQALIHYSDAGCQGNPRTGTEFQSIIKQKLAGV